MSAAKPYVATAAIRDAVRGREIDVLCALGIQWDGRSIHIRCPCPNHADEHPSWRWNSAKALAHCTCTPSASIFDVVCKVKSIDFDAAKLEVAGMIGRADLIRRPGKTKKRRTVLIDFNAVKDVMNKRGEGVQTPGNNAATPQRSQGCTLAAYAAAKKLPVEFLRSLGLADMFYLGKPAIKIPYLDTMGAEVEIRFRIEMQGQNKFRWRKSSKPILYGLSRLSDAQMTNAITLVEGESDCHTLWYVDFPAIGLPGAGNWNENRDAPIFDGIATIYVMVEPDTGGEIVRKWLAKSKIRDRVKLVRLDGFKDASALYLDDPRRFAERWKAALEAAMPWRDEVDRQVQVALEAALRECDKLARRYDILSKAVEAVQGAGLVGEERAVKLIYLAVTSRLLARIVSIAVKGPSSGGKSFLVEIVLKLFPPEAFYVLTAMSERALAYGEEPLAHRIIVLYEAAGLAGDFGTYLVRSLLSEGRICYDTVEKTKDGLKSRRIEREGPTGLITTTTATHLHPENETRLLSLTISDTPAQTKAVMRAQAKRQGRTDDCDLAPWHALQQFLALAARQVVIPFAMELAELIPAVAVRLRRDFPTILALIEAHSLLHQLSREQTAEGAIVATLDDYSAVRKLVTDLISDGVGATVSETVRETVGAVGKLANGDSSNGVPLTKLAQELKLDKSATSRRTKDAIAQGYLRNLEDKKGRPARLVIGDPLPADIEVLPTVETLRQRCSVAPLKEGIGPSPSPTAENAEEKEEEWTL
jgi:hypothetical protein